MIETCLGFEDLGPAEKAAGIFTVALSGIGPGGPPIHWMKEIARRTY
jgi:hypothetical protein